MGTLCLSEWHTITLDMQARAHPAMTFNNLLTRGWHAGEECRLVRHVRVDARRPNKDLTRMREDLACS